jgi:hypothetical protein
VSDVPIVLALPPYAPNGEERDLLVDSQALYGGPYLWRCRFRKSSPDPYKWHVLEGPPLRWDKADYAGPTTSQTFVALGTNGAPAVVVPAAGIYDVDIGGRGHQNGSATFYDVISSPQFGSAAARDVDGLYATVNSSRWDSMAWRSGIRGTVPGAGQAITMMFRTTAAVNSYIQQRVLLAHPVRLGAG